MTFEPKTYRNGAKVGELGGINILVQDVADACLRGRLNLFLQGNTGDGKTQLAVDVMDYFTDTSMFVLGRNDMDIRELFSRINIGRLYQRPAYNLEPIISPDTGEVEYYYPKFDPEKKDFVYEKVSGNQARAVRYGLERLAGTTEDIKELTSRINTHLFVVDELPNCIPAVRAQLFNLFDGHIEINGRFYPMGGELVAHYPDGRLEILTPGTDALTIELIEKSGAEVRSITYSIGIATGNLGQQFTESSNELGRALRDRMHVILDTDHFRPEPIDTYDILTKNRNPRVSIEDGNGGDLADILMAHETLRSSEVPFEKYMMAQYLIHGLDYIDGDFPSKIAMKSAWPNAIEGHAAGSDATLILPVSKRAAKSIITLSQALDQVALEKGARGVDPLESMLLAFKLVSAYSGILNEAAVRQNYSEDHYKAMDSVITVTRQQFSEERQRTIAEGIGMAAEGKRDERVLGKFTGRWSFMKNLLKNLSDREAKEKARREAEEKAK